MQKSDYNQMGVSVLGTSTFMTMNDEAAHIQTVAEHTSDRASVTWVVGSSTDPKPTKLALANLDYAFSRRFWDHDCGQVREAPYYYTEDEYDIDTRTWLACCHRRTQYHHNVRRVLEEYADLKNVLPPIGARTYTMVIMTSYLVSVWVFGAGLSVNLYL